MNSVVAETDFSTFLNGQPKTDAQILKDFRRAYRTGLEAVAFARRYLGTAGYSLIRHNCEHFANFVRYNDAVSLQVENMLLVFFEFPMRYALWVRDMHVYLWKKKNSNKQKNE